MTETTKEELAGWQSLNECGLWTEDPAAYVSDVHLTADEMYRLLADADRTAELEFKNSGLASAVEFAREARVDELEAAARKVIASGVLCCSGCCGDNCGCEELRASVEQA